KPRSDWSATSYGIGGVRPEWVSHEVAGGRGSPLFLYKYAPVRELLDKLRAEQGSAHDGIILEYYNPASGGSVLQTLSVSMQLLRGGETTLRQRSTAGRIFVCLEGSGATIVDGERLEWKENDVFVVPGWSWSEHENGAKDS